MEPHADTDAPAYDPRPMAEAMVEAERKRGWSEDHERWSERLKEAFGNVAYWKLERGRKRKLYRRLAEEIIAFVGAPLGPASELEWWSALLEARFGGLDFWGLDAPWKQLHYDNVTREIMLAKRIIEDAVRDGTITLEQS